MSSGIHVSPDHLAEVGSQFRRASTESEQILGRLAHSVHSLESEWSGVTAQHFFQDFEQWEKAMRELNAMLESVGVEIGNVAERFRQADQQG